MSIWRGIRPHLENFSHVEESGERLSQLRAFHRAVLTDEQLLEEALVDLPADRVGCREVGHLAAAGCLESDGEGGVDITVGGLGDGDLGVGFSQFAGEPVHLLREQVLGYGTGVVGLKQLLAFVLGLLLALECPLRAAFGFLLLEVEFVADGGTDLLGVVWSHLEGGIVGGDAVLDPLQTHGRTGAVVAFGLLLDAHKILVGAASAGVL